MNQFQKSWGALNKRNTLTGEFIEKAFKVGDKVQVKPGMEPDGGKKGIVLYVNSGGGVKVELEDGQSDTFGEDELIKKSQVQKGVNWENEGRKLISRLQTKADSAPEKFHENWGDKELRDFVDRISDDDSISYGHRAEIIQSVKNSVYNMTPTRKSQVQKKDKDVQWITVGGHHVPVEPGQSKSEAISQHMPKDQKKPSSSLSSHEGGEDKKPKEEDKKKPEDKPKLSSKRGSWSPKEGKYDLKRMSTDQLKSAMDDLEKKKDEEIDRNNFDNADKYRNAIDKMISEINSIEKYEAPLKYHTEQDFHDMYKPKGKLTPTNKKFGSKTIVRDEKGNSFYDKPSGSGGPFASWTQGDLSFKASWSNGGGRGPYIGRNKKEHEEVYGGEKRVKAEMWWRRNHPGWEWSHNTKTDDLKNGVPTKQQVKDAKRNLSYGSRA